MRLTRYSDRSQWDEVLKRPVLNTESLFDIVHDTINRIKASGDRTVMEYEAVLGKAELTSLAITFEEIEGAEKEVPIELKATIYLTKHNIEAFHAAQRFERKKVDTIEGVTCWQKAVAIEKAGLHIPRGAAPLFSTVLMFAIPAKIVGCKEVVLRAPPDKNGKVYPAVPFAAHLAKVSKIFRVGGVQVVASMAYETESIPKVHKIFSSGSQYVTAAKQLVSLRDIVISMPAGPSGVEVLADESASPVFIATGLLSQAEYGADSWAVLITTPEKLQTEVVYEVERQLGCLGHRDIAERFLANNKLILVKDTDEALELTNAHASEHLIIETRNYMEVSGRIINAGSVFLGASSPESADDYVSGASHTLPMNGYTKTYSGVSLDSFVHKTTLQEIPPDEMAAIGPAIKAMAANEYLGAHENAVTVGLKKIRK